MKRFSACALACGVVTAFLSAQSPAATVHDEAIDGDLSNGPDTPTALAVVAGANDLFGTTTGAGGLDRDFATFVVPVGHHLSGITVLDGTQPSGGVSFIALQRGSALTVNPSAVNVSLLLGWEHFSDADIGRNILPAMGAQPSVIGFTGPLAAGPYALWVQDFGPTLATYKLRLSIAPVPEPHTWALVGCGFGLLGLLRSRNRRRTGR